MKTRDAANIIHKSLVNYEWYRFCGIAGDKVIIYVYNMPPKSIQDAIAISFPDSGFAIMAGTMVTSNY